VDGLRASVELSQTQKPKHSEKSLLQWHSSASHVSQTDLPTNQGFLARKWQLAASAKAQGHSGIMGSYFVSTGKLFLTLQTLATIYPSTQRNIPGDANLRPDNSAPSLTFRNRASYMLDGHTATLQTPHFIYFFNKYPY
jgi:hypothetical protein